MVVCLNSIPSSSAVAGGGVLGGRKGGNAQLEPIRLPLCFSKMGWGRSLRSARSSKDSAVLEDGLKGPQTGWKAMSTEYLAVPPYGASVLHFLALLLLLF